MGRTVRELEETLDAAEWNNWLVFLSTYDLPDAYFMTAQLGCLVAAVAGNKLEPDRLVAYYKNERPLQSRGIPEFVAFAQGYVASQPSGSMQRYRTKRR